MREIQRIQLTVSTNAEGCGSVRSCTVTITILVQQCYFCRFMLLSVNTCLSMNMASFNGNPEFFKPAARNNTISGLLEKMCLFI